MALSKRYKNGRPKYVIWLASAFGLLIALIVFLRNRGTANPLNPQPVLKVSTPLAPTPVGPPSPPSTVPPSPEIDFILTGAGYSPAMASWWTAISKVETGNYTSVLFKDYNNLFGMTVPSQRRSLRNGEVERMDGGVMNRFSTYATTQDSILDLVIYLQALRYPVTFNSVDDLVAFMRSKGYFTASLSSYLANVKRYL